MKKAIFPILVLGFVLSLSFSPVLAMQIDTLSEYGTISDFSASSASGSSGTVSSSISHTAKPSGYFDATAAGNESGNIAASASIALDNGTGGPTLENYAYGLLASSEAYTVENDGNYSYNFNIGSGQLSVTDNGDLLPGTVGAGYAMGIYLGDTVDNEPAWLSAFALYNGVSGVEMAQVGESLVSTYFDEEVDGGHIVGYDFGPYSGSLDLGFLSAGDEITISQLLLVGVTAADYGVGADAYFGDPQDLSNAGMVAGELIASNAPVPAAFLLFGSGLVGLVMLRRNKFVRQ